nr:D-alanyl-D-alanine carboxypeptidase [Actinomycetota bacterium]
MNNDDGPGAAQVDPQIADADADAVDGSRATEAEDSPAPAGGNAPETAVLFPDAPERTGAASLFPPREEEPLFPALDSAAAAPLFGGTPDPAPSTPAAATKDPAIASAPAGAAPVLAAPARTIAPEPVASAAAAAAPRAAQPLPSASLVRGPDRAPTAALSWVDVARVGAATGADAPTPARALLDDAPRRSLARPAVLLPLAGVLAVAVAYGATTALWPLNAVKPVTTAVAFQPVPAAAAATAWPASGSAAVSVQGFGTLTSAEQQVPMASITKLVTVLVALEKLPLKPGEQGPSFAFTQADSDDYWDYLRQDQSALDVPVDGSLTQYQLFEGILLGSANNYADRLAREVWGSDEGYAAAANQWLSQHDLGEIHVVTPSGFDFGNVATPRALITLGEIAEKNPVIAEIVKQKSVELPGAGVVKNTNGLIDDAGIVGIKTGTIGDGADTRYNLLSAKDVTDDGATVRIFVAALGQDTDQGRVDASRALYADAEAALKNQPQTVSQGAVLGTVDTAWGESSQVVAAEDGRVALWNGAAASATTKFSLGDTWKAGEKAGTLALKGPLDSTTVPLELRTELKGPSLWWRLTHPLELFGLTK